MTATTFETIVPDALLLQFLTDDPENADRIYRARDLVQAGHVERSNTPGLWLVRSATTPNGSYHVTNGLCHCPDTARVGGLNCKHALACRIYRAVERAEVDAEQDEDAPYCPLHGDDECDWGCPGPSLDPLTVRVDPEDSILDLWPTPDGEPCEMAPPVPVGTITRLPMPPELQALADELFGMEA